MAAGQARLFATFDLHILWNKPGNQTTITIEITDATLAALPAIPNPGQDGYHDTTNPATTTTPAGTGHLTQTPVAR